jgi:8-hydroxy-5-deazaflavin:NADPH oxidoreductase
MSSAHPFSPAYRDRIFSQVLEADTIILAVPFGEHREVAKALPSWKGKTVIDGGR